ncbi:hypothetical protein TSTA_094870 [Talaromyces stipitatus ATCC 10500]|uniref:C2H2-type domain-containing protein n=1 Tax=Talaromyces stipitatus (strain ATCC 10500 / CBS 375.48 / QM 6759 / NRRL 1006) TaxID=441959 RepID=B8M2Y6_TALSN|nr:uncharacterized protein TSTA_094870 [Talaromyces stipitatus ATCC 10500]EED22241.1 hypothetical protein TSTA_094870 [Talaromyces stipitatus ATCC 10500]
MSIGERATKQRKEESRTDCDMMFKTQWHANRHDETHTRSLEERKKYKCPECNDGFTTKPALERHIKGMHTENPNDLHCETVKQFLVLFPNGSSKAKLFEHPYVNGCAHEEGEIMQGEGIIQQEINPVQISRLQVQNKSTEICLSYGQNLPYLICKKLFWNTDSLLAHIRTYDEKTGYACPLKEEFNCQYFTATPGKADEHARTVHRKEGALLCMVLTCPHAVSGMPITEAGMDTRMIAHEDSSHLKGLDQYPEPINTTNDEMHAQNNHKSLKEATPETEADLGVTRQQVAERNDAIRKSGCTIVEANRGYKCIGPSLLVNGLLTHLCPYNATIDFDTASIVQNYRGFALQTSGEGTRPGTMCGKILLPAGVAGREILQKALQQPRGIDTKGIGT